ncbi:Y' element ATP-dependent helicase YPR204W-like [Rhinatrema bivittatum]|uniref:Y' element ATP-dependent helicase YPR204W-like n=1 Tax=Rhinatrema bivittatum TaxID=194408 RepID=UPI00112E9D8D|nr:Y' element ATP-dependent helicase YPR204W-like [Rhinatrema bivittatum]
MAAGMITSLLLLCAALTLPACADNVNCNISNAMPSANYTLTVSPSSYNASSNYTVTINGILNNGTIVLFQASPSANNNWVNGTLYCTGIFSYQIISNQTSLSVNWTSSADSSITSVNITAYINTTNGISMASTTLSTVIPSTPSTITNSTSTNSISSNSTSTNGISSNSTSTNSTSMPSSVNIPSTTQGSSAPALLSSCTIFGVIQAVILAFLCHLPS